MDIKAVIFDLDGVIADTEIQSEKADDIVLQRYGVVMTEKERHEAIGRRIEEIFGDIIDSRGLGLSGLTVEKLVREKDEVFAGLIKGGLDTIPGSVELVNFFRDIGFKLALATSSGRMKMEAELAALGIGGLFDVIVNGDEITRGKPDPEIFLKAAAMLGVKPENCLVIEDAAFGIRAAKNAGMSVVGFRSPNSRCQDLSEADLVVEDLGTAKEHFGNLSPEA